MRARTQGSLDGHAGRCAAALVVAIAIAGCSKGEQEEPAPSRGEEERTVVTVQSYVYAKVDDSGFKVAERVRDQIKSAFGALRSLRVTGSNQGATNKAEDELYREPLVLVHPDGREEVVLRVWFRYSDEVVASMNVQRGVPILVGGLHRQDEESFSRVVAECTKNTAREREFRGRLQSVFDGSLQGCQDAILAEQAVIDAARVRLDSPEEEIVPEEMRRLYIPVVARLMARRAAQMGRYPKFEPVVPQAGRLPSMASAPGTRTRSPRANEEAAAEGDVSDLPAAARDEKFQPMPAAVGVEQPHGVAKEEPSDPDAPPDPQADVPVVGVAPAGPPKASTPVQPRGEVEGGFEWEDLLDKKFIVLWISLFALYPLLKRRE